MMLPTEQQVQRMLAKIRGINCNDSSIANDSSVTVTSPDHLNPSESTPEVVPNEKSPNLNETVKKLVSEESKTRFSQFSIFFRNAESLVAGDVVHGWIELKTEHPFVLHQLWIAFYGEIKYEMQMKSKTVRFEQRLHPLWKPTAAHPDGISIQPGFYVYDFYIGSGRHLPATFSAQNSDSVIKYLSYVCEVKLVEFKHGRIFEHNELKRLHLKRPPSMGRMVKSGQSLVTAKGLMPVRNVLDMSGNIVATVSLERQIFTHGDALLFHVEVLNCFRRLKVYVALVQKGECCFEGSFSPVQLNVIKLKLGSLRSNDAYKIWREQSIWIPDPDMVAIDIGKVYSERMRNVKSVFILIVKPWHRKPLNVEIPIIIEAPNNTGIRFKNGRCIVARRTL